MKRQNQSLKHMLFKLIQAVLILFFIAVNSLSISSHFGGRHNHLLELASHFQFQYFILTAFCLGCFLVLKHKKTATIAFAFFIFNAIPILPYYIPQLNKSAKITSQISVMQCNLLATNKNYDNLIELVRRTKPDIIAFEEVSSHWESALEELAPEYPYYIIEPEETAFGIALFSKIPLDEKQIRYFGKPFGPDKRMFPSVVAKLTLDNQPLTLVVTHPLPPLRGFEVRNTQLQAIAKHRTALGKNLIVLGDLNITQWSPFFKDFIQAAKLRDSQQGFGIQASWPVFFSPLRIPIDHVLVSDRITVIHRQLGADIGSDHLPVIVQLGLLKQ